jgi:hypothetical protein
MTKNNIIEKYLCKYAEPDALSMDDFRHNYMNVLTIPAFDETFEDIMLTINSISDKRSLVVLVVNSQETSSIKARKSNADLIQKIAVNFRQTWRSKKGGTISLHPTPTCDLLLVDRTTDNLRLPDKTGVGLARKIAADIALKLIYDGNLSTQWIHCTDADAILPKDYFNRTKNLNNFSGAIYPYHHRIPTENMTHKKSILLYELSLRHYVIGLHHAKSDFAVHTIGSTIAVDGQSYATVRGFPSRESGEDFYILNKLQKVGKIHPLPGDPIIVDGRISHRVPYGTGKSVEKISLLENPEDCFLFYHPQIFYELAHWLDMINNFSGEPSNIFSPESAEIKNNRVLRKTLENIGAFTAIETAMQCSKNSHIRKKHLLIWFDGFRTLKFIHAMRDSAFPSIPLHEVIKHPLYTSLNLRPSPTLEEIMMQFKIFS